MTPAHIALLGDSIFDNGAYTSGAPDVVSHLRKMLPRGWSASLQAVDGSRTSDLDRQLAKVPPRATHLVVAIGGNDALSNRDLLMTPVASTAEALGLFADRIARFEAGYRAAVASAMRIRRTLLLCTIYNGWLDRSEARIARIALTTFNDVILRVAIEQGLAVIDLRFVCDEQEDYANPIEPSGIGGRKIANAIAAALGLSERPLKVSHVYVGADGS
jgi:hypothetical protein